MSLYIPIKDGLIVATDDRNWMTLEGPAQTATQFAPTLPLLIKVSDKLRRSDLAALAPALARIQALEAQVQALRQRLPRDLALPEGERIWMDEGRWLHLRSYRAKNKFGVPGRVLEHQLAIETTSLNPKDGDDIWAHNATLVGSLDSYLLFALRISDSLEAGLADAERGLAEFRANLTIAWSLVGQSGPKTPTRPSAHLTGLKNFSS